MIGFYIHHHGRGHISRATAIARALGSPVVGLSTLRKPAAWCGDWVQLPTDVSNLPTDADADADAHGSLHWVPLGHAGLRDRMATISAWIGKQRPKAMVVDISVEVALLARLHGVPVITIALPGHRSDAAHTLGFSISSAIIAAWPAEVDGMIEGLPPSIKDRFFPVGAISRLEPRSWQRDQRSETSRNVVVLGGSGGDCFSPFAIAAARSQSPEWDWVHLGASGMWTEQPLEFLRRADVVVSHAGEGALADISIARKPAIIIPQPRPYGEQTMTGRALTTHSLPVDVHDRFPSNNWSGLLENAALLDGEKWRTWNDGGGARRAAHIISAVTSPSLVVS